MGKLDRVRQKEPNPTGETRARKKARGCTTTASFCSLRALRLANLWIIVGVGPSSDLVFGRGGLQALQLTHMVMRRGSRKEGVVDPHLPPLSLLGSAKSGIGEKTY